MTNSTKPKKSDYDFVKDAFLHFATKHRMQIIPTSGDVFIVHKAKFNGVTLTSAPADGPVLPPPPTMTADVYALGPCEIKVDATSPTSYQQQVTDEVGKLLRGVLDSSPPDEGGLTVVLGDHVSSVDEHGATVFRFRVAFSAVHDVPNMLPLLILSRLAEHCSFFQSPENAAGLIPENLARAIMGTNAIMHLANPDLGTIAVPTEFSRTQNSTFLTRAFSLFMTLGAAIDPRRHAHP